MRIDNVKRKERQRDWGSCYRTRERRFYEATPTGLVDDPKESCTGARRTETCVVPRDVDALPVICFPFVLCCSRSVFYFYFISSVRASLGRRGVLPDSLLLFSFLCSADNFELDWPPCKVVFFFWLVTNTPNHCEK